MGSMLHSRTQGMMGFNLEENVNSEGRRRQVHGHDAAHRVFSASRTTENQRGFPSGASFSL
jgi:hypothetical protein